MIIAEKFGTLQIGRQLEDGATKVLFNYADIATDHPDGQIFFRVLSPGAEYWHEVILTPGNDPYTAIWVVSDNELIDIGTGEAQLVYRWGEDLKHNKKSKIWQTVTGRALVGNGVEPPEWEDLLEQMEVVFANTRAAADQAIAAAESIHDMTADAETLPAGSEATAEYDPETGIMHFGIPHGHAGDDAPQIDDEHATTTNPWSGSKVAEEISTLNNTKVDKSLIGDTPASEQTAAKLLVQEEVQTSLLDQAVDGLMAALDALYFLSPQAEDTMEDLIVNVEQSNGLLNDIYLALKESEAV